MKIFGWDIGIPWWSPRRKSIKEVTELLEKVVINETEIRETLKEDGLQLLEKAEEIKKKREELEGLETKFDEFNKLVEKKREVCAALVRIRIKAMRLASKNFGISLKSIRKMLKSIREKISKSSSSQEKETK
jgi:DNA-binding transcriptional MerR regulator